MVTEEIFADWLLNIIATEMFVDWLLNVITTDMFADWLLNVIVTGKGTVEPRQISLANKLRQSC